MSNSQIKKLEIIFGENLSKILYDCFETYYQYNNSILNFNVSSSWIKEDWSIVWFSSLNKEKLINQSFHIPNINLVKEIKFLLSLYE
jgi:hypothetical protein